ncbi:MAG: DNA topoisomerase [Oscillospiraceae bacterium]|nr:DNA topoisomerase [Oscillospiraceae bacterium]
MAKETNYSYLKALKGPDQVRLRPAVIFGSDSIEGCRHSVFEIISNSIDEAREGFGKRIVITLHADKSVTVEDNGRGIPIDYNKSEEKYNWELAFCTLYAGGKYDNNSGETYSYALGLNGLGLCATQFASEYMEVESCRGTWKYTLRFEKGFNVTDDERGFKKSKCDGTTGTKIHWKPDLEVFTDIDIGVDFLVDMLRRQAIVNDGVEFLLREEAEDGTVNEQLFCYAEGINDYLREVVGDKAITTPQFWSTQRVGKDRDDKEEYKLKMNVAFVFSKEMNFVEHYHNSSWLEHGGSPEDAMRRAFLSQIDGYLKTNNKYNKNEKPIKWEDISDCLVFISSNFSTQASYANQTKKAVTNSFIKEAMTDWLKHQLEVYFLENPDEAVRIAERVIINKRSRENAENVRSASIKNLTQKIDLTNRIDKFVDCRSKDVSRREVYIVEGDSALGSVKLARDAEFQAVIPVRGKILNCLKASHDKIFKSEIITNLIKVLGCGVEVKTGKNKSLSSFNLDNLRWSKVVICTDADEDGFQIRTLILTMIHELCPTLIEKGFVYIAESPLYEITTKERTYFAYTEPEKTKILGMIGDKKYTIQRSKGLGENDPDMMSLTTMNPETRRLIKVTPTDMEKTRWMFDVLLGNDLAGRKQFIQENGSRYLDSADIS